MNKKGIEQSLVILLFVLVLVTFSFAERDSKRLDHQYKTAQLLQKKKPAATVRLLPSALPLSR